MIKNFNELNDSFREVFLFRIGSEAGFFSEYNNMILAILYCLKKNIRFSLYSSDANFSFDIGWQDYFKPFCEEKKSNLNRYFNQRQIIQKNIFNSLGVFLLKKIENVDLLTFELWPYFHNRNFEQENFSIAKLGIEGSILDACRVIDKLVWNYNDETKNIIENKIKTLMLPENYIGFHIRAGDKFLEHELLNIKNYMNTASSLSSLKDAFVLTDDYNIIFKLQEEYPTWTFKTLCLSSEKGYFHQKFQVISKEQKRDAHLRLFASIDILSKSQLFVGTYSSNPGMVLGMKMDKSKIKCIDYDTWLIW